MNKPLHSRGSRKRGFTLIELMIVVAIIGILATIGIPTFLRFQLKSKVAEVKSNIAAINTTQEVYFSEWGRYVSALPPGSGRGWLEPGRLAPGPS